jgi:hypothetical protein
MFYQWNLGVEYQATRSLLTRVAYAGSHATHLWSILALNPTWNSGPNKGQRIYSPVYATEQIGETNTRANSRYNSLQLSAEQRAAKGLTILANYTWSKSLDDEPYNQSSTSGGPNYVLPIYEPNFRRLDDGPSDFDHRNVSSIPYVYNLPRLGQARRAIREFTNGWQTSGIFQFRSGDPLTILSGQANNSGTGQSGGGAGSGDRAVMTGSPFGGSACPAGSICKSYLNPASFANNAVGTYGTFVKGSLVGPQYADWDVSAVKEFAFTERLNLQFRAEFFNVLNHTNFSDPANTIGTTLGQITGAADPRIGQLSLKLVFCERYANAILWMSGLGMILKSWDVTEKKTYRDGGLLYRSK